MNSMLDINPDKRLSIEQALNHAWMVQDDEIGAAELKQEIASRLQLIQEQQSQPSI